MVQVWSESFECKVPAWRMWHGLFKDAHNCLPKALPLKVVSVEYPHAQHGFEFPGAERVIKFHQGISDEIKELLEKEEALAKKEGALAKGEVGKVGDVVHKEALLGKGEVEKVGDVVHKEALLGEEKEKEVVGVVHKEVHKEVLLGEGKAEEVVGVVHKEVLLGEGKAKEVVGVVHKEALHAEEKEKEVVGAAHKGAYGVKHKIGEEAGAAQKEAQHIKEEVGGAAYKGAHFMKQEVGGATHAVVEITEKAVHKGEEEGHKAGAMVEKLGHKEEEEVGKGLHKMGEFLKHDELWVKEKIEEVDEEAFKISISVLAGGLMTLLFKHCKHTLKLSHTQAHGSILHWTSEFDDLSSGIHLLHSFDKLKKHALETFHGVEAYLLKHDDHHGAY